MRVSWRFFSLNIVILQRPVLLHPSGGHLEGEGGQVIGKRSVGQEVIEGIEVQCQQALRFRQQISQLLRSEAAMDERIQMMREMNSFGSEEGKLFVALVNKRFVSFKQCKRTY